MNNANGGLTADTRGEAHNALYEISSVMVTTLQVIGTQDAVTSIDQIDAALACFQGGLAGLPDCTEVRTLAALYGRLREIHAALECAHVFRFPLWLLAAIRGELDAVQGYISAFQRAA